MSIFQLIGIAGFICYIVGFALLQLRMLAGESVRYTLLNLAGASLVLVSLIDAFNVATFLISVSWIVIGLVGLGLRLGMRPPGGGPGTAASTAK